MALSQTCGDTKLHTCMSTLYLITVHVNVNILIVLNNILFQK